MGWQAIVIIVLVCAIPSAAAAGWFLRSWQPVPPFADITLVPPAVPASDAAPAPTPRPRPSDEGYTGGQFLVLKDFKIPDLGCYWAGHTYSTTTHNATAVNDAIELGNAVMTVPPR